MEKDQSFEFIMNTIRKQRQQDHEEFMFKWLLELNEKANEYYENENDESEDASKLHLKNTIIRDYNDMFTQMYFMHEISADDITVANYHEKMKEREKAPKPSQELIFKEGSDGQTKFVLSRGGKRKGAGRKKSGKEIRTVKVALDPLTWMTIEGIKEIEEMNMSELLSKMIEKGLDSK